MKLTPDAVHTLIKECLFQDDEDKSDPAIAEGITRKFGFNRSRIAAHTDEIKALLAELPDEFQKNRGGGWSFLNACMDRHGFLWTGEHATMEELFCLGIASGAAKWLLPRDMWNALPGGMPYVMVNI